GTSHPSMSILTRVGPSDIANQWQPNLFRWAGLVSLQQDSNRLAISQSVSGSSCEEWPGGGYPSGRIFQLSSISPGFRTIVHPTDFAPWSVAAFAHAL